MTSTCTQAAVYGACINARYLEVEKDMCKEQFAAFKNCVTKAVRCRTQFKHVDDR